MNGIGENGATSTSPGSSHRSQGTVSRPEGMRTGGGGGKRKASMRRLSVEQDLKKVLHNIQASSTPKKLTPPRKSVVVPLSGGSPKAGGRNHFGKEDSRTKPEQVKKEEAEKGTKLSKSGLERHEKNSTNDPDTLRSMQSKFSARTYEGRDKIEDELPGVLNKAMERLNGLTPVLGGSRRGSGAFTSLSLTEGSLSFLNPSGTAGGSKRERKMRMSKGTLDKHGSTRSAGAMERMPSSIGQVSRLQTSFRNHQPNTRRPKVARHATQLDMLRKLKRMAPFDRAAEHEFLVNMYKLRGSYVSSSAISNVERIQSGFAQRNFSMMAGDARRGSFSANIFEKISQGIKLKIQDYDSLDQRKKDLTTVKFTREGYKFLFKPSDISKWESFVAVLVVIQMLVTPYLICFNVQLGDVFTVIELAVDILFCLDILIQFNVAYELSGDEQYARLGKDVAEEQSLGADSTKYYETRRKNVIIHYLKGWFFIDFLAIIPLFTNQGQLSLTKTLRLPRLFRLLKVARVFRSLRSNGKLRRFLLYSKYTSAFRLVAWILGIFIINHFIACIWWAVASESIKDMRHEKDQSSDYVTAYFQSVLLMMGEKIDLTTNNAKFFAVVIIIVLSIFVAVLFGEVAMLVTSFNANSQKYQRKMTELYEAMDTMGLPVTLQERVLQFYDFLWMKHHSLNGKTAMYSFMHELSPNLAKEIQMCTYKEMLLNVGFFREFTADVIHHLVMSLESKIFMPRDFVISVGECGTDMFFIDYGRAEVFLKHAHVKTLRKNDYFGEIALITDVRRTASVQASTFLQVVCLDRVAFEKCAEDMTVEGRKRVLAHILKQYHGKDILQRCSEPDFVYEDGEVKEMDGLEDEALDVFNDDFDPLADHIAAEEDEMAEVLGAELNTVQRLELIEQNVENMNSKLDKLVNMNIKIMTSSEMWKARQMHDEKTLGINFKKELQGEMGRVVKGEKSPSAPIPVTGERARLQTAPEPELDGLEDEDLGLQRKTVSGVQGVGLAAQASDLEGENNSG